ncbi:MAG: hypothetical protein R8G66_01275 [Cytophagales bacterium]|nr:hypothetical protein [Cytophagales bacterium]
MSNNKSYLSTLGIRELEEVGKDLSFQERYEFIYFIDPHDIINYCIPFGFAEDKSFEPFVSADKFLSMYAFFDSSVTKILPDEYRDEIIGLKKKIESFYSTGQLRDIDDFKDYFKKENIHLIEQRLTLLTSIMLDQSTRDINRFKDLFSNNKILIEENSDLSGIMLMERDDVFEAAYSPLASDIESRPESYYAKEFEKEYEKGNYTQYVKYVTDRRTRDLENIRNDALVYSKVLRLNRHFQETNQSKIAIFLSSADNVQKFKNIRRLEIGETSIDCIRSSKQLFANFTINGLYKKGVYSYAFLVQTIKRHLLLQHRFSDRVRTNKSKKEEQALELINDLINSGRNKLENLSVFIQYDNFRNTVQESIKSKKVPKYYVDKMNKALEELDQNGQDISNALEEVHTVFINLGLYDGIRSILNATGDFYKDKNFGIDSIESIKQQLPLVFDYSNLSDDTNLIRLFKQLAYYFSIHQPSIDALTDLKEYIIDRIGKLTTGSPEEILVKMLVYLSIPYPTGKRGLRPNAYAVKQIQNMLAFSVKRFGKKRHEEYFTSIYKELKYVQVWAARRSGAYIDGIRLTKRYIAEYPQDPRFHHSLCLLLYCLAFKKNIKNQEGLEPISTLTLRRALQSGIVALELYGDFENRKIIESRYAKEALLNTIAFLFAYLGLQGSKRPKRAYILKSRQYLVSLKQLVKSFDNNYSTYSEYLATESYVELAEFLLSEDEGQSNRNKLEAAAKAISLAIKKAKPHNKKVLTKYLELRNKIKLLKNEYP